MSSRLHRTFPDRERFVGEFVRRLSAMGMEINLPGDVAPPAGTVLGLDLRLEDGTPLVVGTGEVTAGGRPGGAFRVRFLELTAESRAVLGDLVSAVAARTEPPPAPAAPAVAESGGARSLEDLVAETYGGGSPSPGGAPSDAVLVPPAGALGDSGGSAGGSPEPEVRPDRAAGDGTRPGVLRRLGVSPGLVLVALIAGATGAAAHAWFNELASFLFDVSSEPADAGSTVIDIPPRVAPSRFSVDPPPPGTTLPEPAAAPPGQAQVAPLPVSDVPDSGAAAADLPDDPPANRVRLITWEEGPSETVVTFRGNGPFLAERIERVRVPGSSPREVIKLLGIDLPYRQTFIPLGSPEVKRIRTGFHPEDRINELHVVLDLAGPEVRLDRTEHGSRTLRLHLRSDAADGPDPAEE